MATKKDADWIQRTLANLARIEQIPVVEEASHG